MARGSIKSNYLEFIPSADWPRLIDLATEKRDYMTNIIESDPDPKRQKQAPKGLYAVR